MTGTTSGSTGRKGKGRRKGLKIPRIFTTEGVHPYDTLEWERRDVVMTNWRDGTVNFEQRGVEFPATWSMNATQIVTGKYFRGALGTPQREWSLKQLIDRVVGVYTRTGREHGYFAAEADAEVFDHELKYALSHQLFSFNSPVWFNVGTPSSQQVSACQPYDAPVSTPAGLVPIGELVATDAVGTKVYDAHGITRITATKANGVKPVLRLHTESGHTLDVTADHLVWRSTGDAPDQGRFVPAARLRPGDTLQWHRRDAHGESEILPADIAEAALAGWLRSDGSVGPHQGTNGSLTVEATTVTPAELAWVSAALDTVFPGVHREETRVPARGESPDRRRTRLHGNGLADFAERWGLMSRGTDTTVPPGLFTAPSPVVRAYLRSIFQAEGYVSDREHSALVGVDMTSGEFLRGVQRLLLRFGIFAGLRRKEEPGGNRGDLWSLGIRSLGDRELFHTLIGFVDGRKADLLEASLDRPGRAAAPTERLTIDRVEALGDREVYDIQTESGEYLSGNLRVHNCFILSVDDTMESILDWYKEEGVIFKGGSGAGVNLSRIRSSRELLSSGGSASGPVSFMRGADASAGTIKSGGATRRAAKMVVLDVDHPDIGEFIDTKAHEERKIRALRDAGFDMDLGGADMASVQYQNANNSVRVSDAFMRAVENGEGFGLVARTSGEVVDEVDAQALFRRMAEAAWECADPGVQYDGTIQDWHTTPESGRISASNPCSEYLHLDDSSCNLASVNLLAFLREDGTFDVEKFTRLTELVITAMDVSVTFADFPTEKIAEVTRAYRQLGIGYANLGALLMATGHAYDSEGGRAVAAAVTSLMTGVAYRRSAELAGVVGPYEGYRRNEEAHTRVMREHAAANDALRTVGTLEEPVLAAATRAWAECLETGERHGWRNAQASLLAPTGCLTGDTLVATDRGLARLTELGDVYGPRWQDLSATVSTDEGPRRATKFYVNGEEPTRRIVTEGGYRLQGTHAHRIKVVGADGAWEWKRFADISEGDLVPLQTGTLVGAPRNVALPVPDQAYHTGDRGVTVPDAVDEELAELVGYFTGEGSLRPEGIRLRVADTDEDVVERLAVLAKGCFGLVPGVTRRRGYREVVLSSVRLARWWRAAGFAGGPPGQDHTGEGWTPRVPSAVLETNDPAVYAAFLRGLFEADGTVPEGVPSLSTPHDSFAGEVRTLLLSLGMATTTRATRGGPHTVRLRDLDHVLRFDETVGFMGDRKNRLVAALEPDRAPGRDPIVLPRTVWEHLVPPGHPLRGDVLRALREDAGVPRRLASLVHAQSPDARLGHALGYLFERVAANEDGGVQPTYDLSVPDNVTYVANGLVSHNTIGFMMDCDTTGIEPDFSLVKFKKLVGGGSMRIVNRTVSRALDHLGYRPEQAEAIVAYIAENGHVVDAPGLREEHYGVFDCAMGRRFIEPMGHVRMMASVQPFLSGAISKTVNVPESASVEDFEHLYFQGWKLGLKALAVYRDNCKVGQPLSTAGSGPEAAQAPPRPVRRRLPKKRPSETTSFSVGGAEGYITAGSYPDDGLGEVFMKLGKQGSTLAGVMDAFSIAISIALQYGVPLETYVEKFTNMRFDPAGMTDDPDIRMAQSVMDYIFRRLALDHLSYEERAALGVLSVDERRAQLAGEDPAQVAAQVESYAQSAPTGADGERAAPSAPPEGAHSTAEVVESTQGFVADAPLCVTCGTKMRPAGSCYVCEGCGSTSGCS
ncbi:LAGLIDADG family homing endonuclease [Nocardiopsis flavescens]|uniref:LAGLIDADG family homing endonuclease n=1 Tax=Nocardiopsis flavescens TaxID=758803 RepID=UPI003651363E